MTLRQLQYFCEIAAQGWNISLAAKALHTSQPGISRQMQALEQELRVVIFARHKNRMIGVTEPGRMALAIAQRIIDDSTKLQRLRNEFEEGDAGSLTIAATHTQARHVIPAVLERFTCTHPGMELFLKQGIPSELVRLVACGEADLSLSTMPLTVPEGVVMLPCFAVERIAVVPVGHPLISMPESTLEGISKFPLITYDPAFSSRSSVVRAFERVGLTPKIAISAVDTDVMKAYAAQGLGVAIMSEVAFNADIDRGLHAIQVSHLFGQDTIYLGLRRYTHLRRLIMDFICLYAPKLTVSAISEAVHGRDIRDIVN
jgi:LysR family cys regulon transcriptional activator